MENVDESAEGHMMMTQVNIISILEGHMMMAQVNITSIMHRFDKMSE